MQLNVILWFVGVVLIGAGVYGAFVDSDYRLVVLGILVMILSGLSGGVGSQWSPAVPVAAALIIGALFWWVFLFPVEL